MNFLLFIIVTLGLITLVGYAIHAIVFRQQYWFLILFLAIYAAPYTTVQALVYQQTSQPIVLAVLQYLKELIIVITVITFFLSQRNLSRYTYTLSTTDYWFIAFLGFAGIYALLPLGDAGVFGRLAYYKNIVMPALLYFLGRTAIPENKQVKKLVTIVLLIMVAAFLLNIGEYTTGRHFHSSVGYADYNEDINTIDPQGNFGLSWSFETSSGKPRFGAFFSNPLEESSACLLAFAICVFLLMRTPYTENTIVYFTFLLVVMGCMFFAFSRASMVALFLQLIFISVLFRYYKLLLLGVISMVSVGLYIAYLASDELRYFVIDTLTFQNPSSLGHLLEWLDGIESMIANPMGIGLGMSGNAKSVDDALKVGGENQFIIYGVQLGVIGLLLYVMLLYSAIRTSVKAYRFAPEANDKFIPFVAAVTKFGLLLPLFTANAELYLFVTYISWWMVGVSVSNYNRSRKNLISGIDNG